jgi:ubiquinone/menaquinone biosynthesis C-methylase UbiE/mannose-6-phosphate isomerase-like protein (cupin superfamily)
MTKSNFESDFYKQYAEARKLFPETEKVWMEAVRKLIGDKSALKILDLGSGTGRFAPLLADTFSAEVIGIEPSDRMRGVATENNVNPHVKYLKGSAEEIPLEDHLFDIGWLSQIIHHVGDKRKCAQELHRVLKTDGLVFIRNAFKDRLETVPLYKYFPQVLGFDNERIPSIHEMVATFEKEGFQFVALETVQQTIEKNLKSYGERLRKGGLSSLEHLTKDELEEGFNRLRDEVKKQSVETPVGEPIDLLVFSKSGRRKRSHMIHMTKRKIKPFDFQGLSITDYVPGLVDSASIAEIKVPSGISHKTAKSTRSDKFYFCMEGSISFKVGDEKVTLKPSDLLVIPKNEWFSYSNATNEEARLLLVHVPPFDLQAEEFSEK